MIGGSLTQRKRETQF